MQNQPKADNVRNIARISAGLIVTSATLWLTGCSSASYQKGDSAAVSIQSASADVQGESRALELTMGALRDLVSESPADLKLEFKHFSSALDQLNTAAKRSAATGKRMEARHAAYLQAWDKELAAMDYEHVRELSQTRKTEVANRFEAVKHRYEDSQAVVQPIISYLEDLRRALSADLTPDGLAAMKAVVGNAQQNAAKVQTALAALTTELTNSSSKLASVGAQQQTPQAQ